MYNATKFGKDLLCLARMRDLDSNYVQDNFADLEKELKEDDPKLAEMAEWIVSRVEQSIPDGDISFEDIMDFANDVRVKSLRRNVSRGALEYLWALIS